MRAIRRVTQRAPTAPTRGGWKAWGPLCRWPIGKLGGEVVHVRKIADVVDISKWRCWWRGSGRGLFPEAAVREDLLDEVGLRGLDEADDAHRCAASGTRKGKDLVDAFDEGRPASAGLPSPGRGPLCGLLVDVDLRVVGRVALGPHASRLARVETEITSQVLSDVGDVLGELGDQVGSTGSPRSWGRSWPPSPTSRCAVRGRSRAETRERRSDEGRRPRRSQRRIGLIHRSAAAWR